jgi:tRNA A-37 threonylcarbamoyl transferase component Bud32
MSSSRPLAPPELSPQDEAILEQFEEAWQRGEKPSLEQLVASAPPNDARRLLLIELVTIDMDYRWRAALSGGKPASNHSDLLVESYLKRLPDLGSETDLPVELIAAEYRIRHCWGDHPSHAEYARRFPLGGNRLARVLAEADAESAAEDRSAATVVDEPTLFACPVDVVSSAGALLELLREIPLLQPEQLEGLVQEHGRQPFENVQALARRLLQDDWLTAYQLNQLFQGRGSELVLGPYVVLARLGEGGGGKVLKARHQAMSRTVALKLIRPELLREPDVVERFYREIQIVSQLSHPNIVHAYDAGPIGGTHVLVMEYVEGIDLSRLVKQHGPLRVQVACDYVRQAALGLQHAHERGLVHRDIKPSNLLVTGNLVKVIDLGLARLQKINFDGAITNTLTPQRSVMVGTPDYLAPEQAVDFHSADIRADVYGLGCTLFYLLTGQPPFAGGSLAEKLVRHQMATPPSLREIRADVPAGVEAVLRKMMSKRPEDRFQTPGELAAVLAATHNPAALARLGFTGKSKNGTRRRALLWAGLGAAALVFVVAISLAVIFSARSQRPGVVQPPPTDTAPANYVLEFDGEDDFVALPEDLIRGSSVLTLEGWFRTKRGGVILGFQNQPLPKVPVNWVGALYVGSDGKLHGQCWDGGINPLASSASVNDGRWHHAALVLDGKSQILYLDGEEAARRDSRPINHMDMSYNQIGNGVLTAWPAAGKAAFAGSIKEVVIWYAARKPFEIKNDMHRPPSPHDRGLAAYYPLNEKQGDLALDRSPQRRHARLGNLDPATMPRPTKE